MARLREFNEEEILDKAINLFWIKGYESTSANDLVHGLGLSRSSIYGAYDDKRGLFLKALERYRKVNLESTLELVEKSNDLSNTLKTIFSEIIQQDLSAKTSKGCLIINSIVELAPHDNGISKTVTSYLKDISNALKKTIEKEQQEGKISKKHDSAQLANFFTNSITGLRALAKSNLDERTLNDILEMNMAVLHS